MIVTYLRSSSFNTFRLCEHKYLLESVVGLPSRGGKAADIGTIVHKILEIMALQNIAIKNNKSYITDDNLGKISVSLDWEKIAKKSWNSLTKILVQDWTEDDYEIILGHIRKVLNYKNGMFHPHKMDIFRAEQRFDIELTEPWAKYSYKVGNETIEGRFSIKGTIDLIIKHGDILEVLDWKTGRRSDWATGKTKEFEDFSNDFQFQLYQYAVHKMFPEAKEVYVTIFYTKDGGPFTAHLTSEDLLKAPLRLQEAFYKIKTCENPRAIFPNYKCKWCSFSEISNNGLSRCENAKNELVSLGLTRFTEKYINLNKLNEYQTGGGKFK